jgi:integrase
VSEHVTDWQETGYLFTTRSGRRVEPRNLSRSFDRIVTAAGLPSIVFHDLRRTAATMLKMSGVAANASFDKISERFLPATSSFVADHGLGS